jgi:diaminohydroxyphosphoribosylaminopyrimidine deaminase/5-amino-6-(5-phosphoribosylamino)uracil reductase
VSLARAIELAAGAAGRAYPKPTVGAVVVADGDIVAEGVTERDGRHAEIVALDAAGPAARGASMFVTLEPCAHHGTTPPCVERIVAEGVARVVVGALDPNP